MSEKTHDATDKRLQDMRKQGQVARSQDVGRMVVVAVMVEVVLMARAEIFSLVQEIFALVFSQIEADFSVTGIDTAWIIIRKTFVYSIAMMVIAGAIRILSDCLQLGWVFAPKALKISIEKIDPSKKIKQMFGKAQLWEFLTTLIKLSILGGVGFIALQTMLMPILKLTYGTAIDPVWEVTARVLGWQVRMSTLTLLAVVGLDFFMQKKMHKENARMNLEEIKQEMRESEGDPSAKGAREGMAHEILSGDGAPPPPPTHEESLAILNQTDLLVTNPTHIAIALSYQGGVHPLPIVLYKLRGEMALTFIHQAMKQKIFVKRDPWLARHLFAHCRIGQPITYKAILPVAEYYRDFVLSKPAANSFKKTKI